MAGKLHAGCKSLSGHQHF